MPGQVCQPKEWVDRLSAMLRIDGKSSPGKSEPYLQAVATPSPAIFCIPLEDTSTATAGASPRMANEAGGNS